MTNGKNHRIELAWTWSDEEGGMARCVNPPKHVQQGDTLEFFSKESGDVFVKFKKAGLFSRDEYKTGEQPVLYKGPGQSPTLCGLIRKGNKPIEVAGPSMPPGGN
jgi:hypothetical protein